jgi:cystathionine gamma-synthase
MIHVEYLADYPGLVPSLATLHHAQWRRLLPDWSAAQALEELAGHTRRRAIPTTLVALEGGELLGSVSLLSVDHERLAHLSPWLASLFVVPEQRGRGVARLLIDRLVAEAAALGVRRLYAYTPEHEAMYVRMGWSLLERLDLGEAHAAIVYVDPPPRSDREGRGHVRFETLAVHTAASADPATGAVSPALHLSTTFERAPDGSYPSGYEYIRDGNPNRNALETTLATLEGGRAAVAFASGMAATMAVFQTLAPGDHVLAPLDAYFGTSKLLREVLQPWGLESSFVDMTDPAAVQAALKPTTRLIWTETPSNPTIAVTDLRAIGALAQRAGALVACDNTWATPFLQRPLVLGHDLVVHSTTKYLSGHCDVMGGVVVTREAGQLAERLRTVQSRGGAVPSPFDSWLVLRGIRTLAWRMRAHCGNAAAVAAFLAEHAGVERVHYPGLATDPGFAVASRQMDAAGGMLSFVVRGGRPRAFDVAGRLRLFTRATSLGGPESLVEHRASVEGEGTRAPEGLLRLSIGLEHPDDLVADLAQALAPL